MTTSTEITDNGQGLRDALRRIAEGNLGDGPGQANYARIRQVASEALATPPPQQERAGLRCLRCNLEYSRVPRDGRCHSCGSTVAAPAAPATPDKSFLRSLYDAAAFGFHTSQSCGAEGLYQHVSKFKTLDELDKFEKAWIAAMSHICNSESQA